MSQIKLLALNRRNQGTAYLLTGIASVDLFVVPTAFCERWGYVSEQRSDRLALALRYLVGRTRLATGQLEPVMVLLELYLTRSPALA